MMIVNREIGIRKERQRVIGLDGLRWWRREGLAFSTYFKRIPILYHNKELVVTNSINSFLAFEPFATVGQSRHGTCVPTWQSNQKALMEQAAQLSNVQIECLENDVHLHGFVDRHPQPLSRARGRGAEGGVRACWQAKIQSGTIRQLESAPEPRTRNLTDARRAT